MAEGKEVECEACATLFRVVETWRRNRMIAGGLFLFSLGFLLCSAERGSLPDKI